jgi:uncharacterized protein YndB with AHSA1/START domain
VSNTIRREVSFPQPRDRVWQAIADRATLAEWMFPNDFEPRVGHRFTFHVPPNPKMKFDGMVIHCEVLECDPPGRLAFSWTAGGLTDTRVTFHLEPDGGGTKLILEHTGFVITPSFGEQAFKGAEYGWAKMLKQLAEVVAKQGTIT